MKRACLAHACGLALLSGLLFLFLGDPSLSLLCLLSSCAGSSALKSQAGSSRLPLFKHLSDGPLVAVTSARWLSFLAVQWTGSQKPIAARGLRFRKRREPEGLSLATEGSLWVPTRSKLVPIQGSYFWGASAQVEKFGGARLQQDLGFRV